MIRATSPRKFAGSQAASASSEDAVADAGRGGGSLRAARAPARLILVEGRPRLAEYLESALFAEGFEVLLVSAARCSRRTSGDAAEDGAIGGAGGDPVGGIGRGRGPARWQALARG